MYKFEISSRRLMAYGFDIGGCVWAQNVCGTCVRAHKSVRCSLALWCLYLRIWCGHCLRSSLMHALRVLFNRSLRPHLCIYSVLIVKWKVSLVAQTNLYILQYKKQLPGRTQCTGALFEISQDAKVTKFNVQNFEKKNQQNPSSVEHQSSVGSKRWLCVNDWKPDIDINIR